MPQRYVLMRMTSSKELACAEELEIPAVVPIRRLSVERSYKSIQQVQSQRVRHATGTMKLSKEFMFVLAALNVLLTSGGLTLGFGPVYTTLVNENQWSERCNDGESQCPAQEIRLQNVFSTSFLFLSTANAVFGILLDVVGPRFTATMGLTLSLLGNIAMSAGDTHNGTGGLIIAGYSLIAAGGMGSYLASLQILQLYEVQGFVCSTLSSLFNFSGYIYMLLRVDGVTRQRFFEVYCVVVAVFIVISYVAYPTRNVTAPSNFVQLPGLACEAPKLSKPRGLVMGMREQLRRPDLWFFAVFFGWISLLFGFVGGAIPGIVNRIADSAANQESAQSAAQMYINYLYPCIVNGTFAYSAIIGYVIDHFGFKIIFIACLFLSQAMVVCLIIPSLKLQILGFIINAMAQAALYSLQFAYIMICFPVRLYGTLQAFLAVVSFTCLLFNYALNPWTQNVWHGDYTPALLILGVPTLGLYFFLHLIRECEDHVGEEPTTCSLNEPRSERGSLLLA